MDNKLQDKLIGTLVGVARATEGIEDFVSDSTNILILEGLIATSSSSNSTDEELIRLTKELEEEKKKLIPNCFYCSMPCGKNDNYDLNKLNDLDDDIKSLKLLILFGIKEVAKNAYKVKKQKINDQEINKFFYKALWMIGASNSLIKVYFQVLIELGKINLKCLNILNIDASIDNLPSNITLALDNEESVANLFTLLYQGIINIKIDSLSPLFNSKNVLNYLKEEYKIFGINNN